MYCVKCGVKLQDGEKKCPLCNTPVMYEDNIEEIKSTYSEIYPKESKHKRMVIVGLLSTLFLISIFVVSAVCLMIYSKLNWGVIVVSSILLLYLLIIFPFWLSKPKACLILSIDYVGVSLLLLIINLYYHTNWFLPFALPLTTIIYIISLSGIILFKHIKTHKLLMTGSLFIISGLSTVLIEWLSIITFGSHAFKWSFITLTVLSLIGVFLIICSFIKPIKEYIERKFFI